MGKVRLTATVVGQAAARLLRGSRLVRPIVRREIQDDLLKRLLRVSRQAAPERSGALSRGLRGFPVGEGVEIRSTVRSARGYNYTGVTRVGHRQRWIVPKRKKALAFSVGGKRLVRARVRGYRPRFDWADEAHRLAQPHVARSANRIGRELQAVIG